MSKTSFISKTFAVIFVILTVSVIAGIVTLVIVYNTEIAELNPTPPPILTTPTYPTGPPPSLRLPGNLVPESYKVYLQPYLYTHIKEETNPNITSPNQTMLFTGNSTVNFRCVQNTRTIFLHSTDLVLSEEKVLQNRDNNEKITISGTKHYENQSHFLELQLDSELKEGGNYSLFMAFEGEISSGLTGLYVSRYNEGDGGNTERFLAITQLEPTDARRVFPCFDEPALKAKFDVTIIHRRNAEALSNWVRSEATPIDTEWKFTRFYTTEKMSTYLFAFVVSEFTSTPPTHDRVNIQIYARPEAIKAGHADYAASITGKILNFFEDHLGIKYPQKKLDQIAVPDLGPAAMENWGLITYQEESLLFEEGVSSELSKEWIAITIAHELAHQWFGNLVTMSWWNAAWLKEGFATYMSFLALDHLKSEFQTKDMLFVNNLHSAFEVDSLATSHPLTSPQETVQTPYEILEMFDSITYRKGAAVLRMLADMVTDRVFQAGIKMYLRAFEYGNTEPKDLWECIQKAVDEDGGHIQVAKVMDTWTNQIGFPVITINTTSGEAYQRHFLFNQTSESNLVWHVPVRVKSQTSEPSLVWLDKRSPVTKDEFIAKDGEWLLANFNRTGYYMVNYNPENWDRLLTQLETDSSIIPVINRGQLIDDAFYLARAKLIDVTLALNTTRYLYNETAYLPWDSAVTNLNYFALMFDRSEVYGPMQAYLREQVKKLYNSFSNYTDNSTVPSAISMQYNQINAIKVACTNELPECRIMATTMFHNWMKNETINSIHPNLRAVIYCQAIAAGGEKEWEFAWKRFQSSSDTSEKEQLRTALSCTSKIWLLSRYLQYTLDPDKIRKMDIDTTICNIARNMAGQALAWNFVRAHWNELRNGAVEMLIDCVTQRFSTDFELEELRRFQMDYQADLDNFSMVMEQAIEQTQINIQWVNENEQRVLEWFQSQLTS